MLKRVMQEVAIKWKLQLRDVKEVLFNKASKALKGVKEDIKDDRILLNALALFLNALNVSKRSKGLRRHTHSQIATIDYYITPKLMVRVGSHIVVKFAVAHASDLEHSLDAAYEILDVLLFAPSAQERRRKRKKHGERLSSKCATR